MKKVTLFLAPVLLVFLCSFLSPEKKKSNADARKEARMERIVNTYKPVLEKLNYDMEKFANITPKEYRELTGNKLSIKESIELKQVQKVVKKATNPAADGDIPQWAYILLVVLGWGFIPIGIMSGWEGSDWWVNLLLSFCFWLPGVIHGLIVMKKYY